MSPSAPPPATSPAPPSPTTPAPATTPVTLIGLGAMGQTLGKALLGAGHPLTVWNRTIERTTALADDGANVAGTASEAVAASPLVVLCLRDAHAVEQVLSTVVAHLSGRHVVNLTSSTPDEARDIAGHVVAAGGSYLDGAIMVPTPMIGDTDAMLVLSGDRGVLDRHVATLEALGGQLPWLGDDPGLAAVYDLGMLDLYLAGMAAFLHAAALVEAEGVSVTDFLPFAAGITDVLRDSLSDLARDVAARSYPGTDDTTEMELAVAEHIIATSRARGLDTSVPQLTRDLLAGAVADGHGGDSFSSIYERFAPAQ